jgi:hypothetical protein
MYVSISRTGSSMCTPVYEPMKHVCAHEACVCPWSMCVPMKHVCTHEACVCPWSMRVPMKHVCTHEACVCPWSMCVPMKHVCTHEACVYPWSMCVPMKHELELELEVVVSFSAWVLGCEIRSSVTTGCMLNHWAISPSSYVFIFYNEYRFLWKII